MKAPQHALSCAFALMLSSASWSSPTSVLPTKVTLNADCILPIPFAVSESVLPVKAGTEVRVKSLHGDKIKVSHGVGEGMVQITDTDFAARLPQAKAEAEAARAKSEAARVAAAQAAARATPEQNPFGMILRDIESDTASKADILVLSWSWGPSAGGQWLEAVGEIRNVSGRRLESVQAELTTRDASGNVVNSDTAMVRDVNLEPNQDTRFQVGVRRKGGEQSASLAFRRLFGDRYPHREQ
jgi:hypothetical protein